ncbi:MAG: hypothetical protein Q4B13_04455 [Lautropia sp.]|nr:hypothetical protein [Lautropia sp.]
MDHPSLVTDIAPTGRLRAVTNPGNAVLARQAPPDSGRILPGASLLRSFIEHARASGEVSVALNRHHIDDATVAPPTLYPLNKPRLSGPINTNSRSKTLLAPPD